MLDIQTRVTTTKAVAALDGFTQRQKNLTAWFRAYLAPSIADEIRRQFETKGRRFGKPWAPLSETTIAIRERRGGSIWGSTYPMVDTGRGMQSLTDVKSPDGLRVYEPMRFTYGTLVDYLDLHQTGFTVTHVYGKPLKTPTDVPARPVVPDEWPERITDLWAESAMDWVAENALRRI